MIFIFPTTSFLYYRFGGPTSKLMKWFNSIARFFNTPVKMQEFQEFRNKNELQLGHGKREWKLVNEQIAANIYWKKFMTEKFEQTMNLITLDNSAVAINC